MLFKSEKNQDTKHKMTDPVQNKELLKENKEKIKQQTKT